VKLETLFFGMVGVGAVVLILNFYESSKLKNSIPDEVLEKIDIEERRILERIEHLYSYKLDAPLSLQKLHPSMYGVTIFDGENVEIVLNRSRLKESLDYMIDDVMPHEFAHALLFKFGKYDGKDGHSREWQRVCLELEGSRCDRFVNHRDIIFGKIGF
jgi:hypothetical protein